MHSRFLIRITKISNRLKLIRNHGLVERNVCQEFSYNSRLDTIQAAVLLPKLEILDKEIYEKNLLALFYNNSFEKLNDLFCPITNKSCKSAWAQYTLIVSKRDELIKYLEDSNIPTAIHYPLPLNKQPAIQDLEFNLPVGNYLSKNVLSLPIHPYMDNDTRNYIVNKLINFYKND